jgi:hypothetical protein
MIPFIGLFVVIIYFYFTNRFGLRDNGRCDLITGPSDTGLSFMLLVTVIINYFQYKILTHNSPETKRK